MNAIMVIAAAAVLSGCAAANTHSTRAWNNYVTACLQPGQFTRPQPPECEHAVGISARARSKAVSVVVVPGK